MKTNRVASEVRRVRIEEAAEALALLLECLEADQAGKTVKKVVLLKKIEEYVNVLRWESGVKVIPTVLNREVKAANETFCRNNWKEIRETAAKMGYFIIWNPKGEPLGMRLGTIEEYREQQAWIMNATEGFADFHNERSEIIRDHGKRSGDLDVKLKRSCE